MISIIICSRNKDIQSDLRSNIHNTIGGIEQCDYEFVVIDNSDNGNSICAAYNEGVRRSKGDILLFIHEDVVFHTEGWGKIVESKFEDIKIGMLGLAGTHMLPHAPSSWWAPEVYSTNYIHGAVIDGKYCSKMSVADRYKAITHKLVSADGFFLCFPRRIFEQIRWDENMLKGFHGYDTDISLQVLNAGYDIQMVWDVLVEHKGPGNSATRAFFDSQDLIFNKWQSFLPQVRGTDMTAGEIEARELLVRQKRMLSEMLLSNEYRVGNILLHPKMLWKSIIRHLNIF